MLSLIWAVSATAETEGNLCYNGNFDNPKGALDGWNVNYEWMDNSHFMKNHEFISVLPSFQGHKNVLWANPPEQARVESKIIPIEKGVRYKCTLDLNSPGDPGNAYDVRLYFNCYKWEPGIAPHPEPKLSELRRIYKGVPATGGSDNKWKTISFYLPMEELSEAAWSRYKEARFATVYLTRYRGEFHVANVKVVKLPETYKIAKTATVNTATSHTTLPRLLPTEADDEDWSAAGAASSATLSKPGSSQDGNKPSPIDDSNE